MISPGLISSFFGSDHYPILLSEIHPSPLPSGSSRWNFDHADWAEFSLATEISTPLLSFATVDTAHGFFNHFIFDDVKNIILCVSSSFKICLPLWIPECTAVSREKKLTLATVAIPSGLD